MHRLSDIEEKRQQEMKGKRAIRRPGNNNNGGIMRSSFKKEAFHTKVVYISTPMKVTICSSKFKEIVQQLTGLESDVARFMESYGDRDTWIVPDAMYDKS